MGRKIILAGGSGFLGRAVARVLAGAGAEVVVLSRQPRANEFAREVGWDAATAGAWIPELEGAAAVVNFTGRSINCVPTAAHRREILESRIKSVQALGAGFARASRPPAVWVQCSATGFYGDAGERVCGEDQPAGDDFLADVCRQWEETFSRLELPGVRRVVLRLGVVLDRGHGIFPPLAKLTRAFLGGAAGNGRQYVTWIHREDLMKIFVAAIDQPEMTGTYNACAPDAVTNTELMRELRAALHRRWSPPAPALAVRLAARFIMRTDGDLILHGQRGYPQRLLDRGFQFEFPGLNQALQELVKKQQPDQM